MYYIYLTIHIYINFYVDIKIENNLNISIINIRMAQKRQHEMNPAKIIGIQFSVLSPEEIPHEVINVP